MGADGILEHSSRFRPPADTPSPPHVTSSSASTLYAQRGKPAA